MNTDILDDQLIKNEVSLKPRIINWCALIILWVGVGYSAANGLLSETRFMLGILLLILSTGITYWNYELGTKTTLIIILIGALNIVDFFSVEYFVSFKIHPFEIGFEFLLFGIGILHYFTNKQVITKFMKNIIARGVSEEEIESEQLSRINGFKMRFKDQRVDELEKIASDDKFVPEARKAAEELMLEKFNSQSVNITTKLK